MERFDDIYMPEDEWTEEEQQGFEITDAATADWAISKIAEERKRKDFFVNCAKAEIEKLKNQIKDAETKCDNATAFLTGKLGIFLENEDVPKKKTTTQLSVTLPAGKIIKKLPKQEIVMADGSKVTDKKTDVNFINEVRDIDAQFIKTTEEVSWGDLKKKLTIKDGMVMVKETGEMIESLGVNETLPSIEIKTE